MNPLADDISKAVFKRTFAIEGQVSLTVKMLQILAEIDGKNDIDTISRKVNSSLSDMRPLVSKLMAYGIIEEVRKEAELLDMKFLGFLAKQLSKITGPIAKVMVEDAVLEMGNGVFKIPKSRAVELVELLEKQLPEGKKRNEFVKCMLQELDRI